MDNNVSIVIPAYNEGDGIGPVLEHLLGKIKSEGMVFEVIVVDDGSEDNTAEVAGRYDEVTVIRHSSNRGYGAALKTGMCQAKHDLICITDADGTYPNERIPELVEKLVEQEYDMVVGSRTGEDVAIPLIRRPAKWVIGRMASFVAGESIPDLNSGLRVFSKGTALRMFNILPDGFSLTTTITLAMLTNSFRVAYVPIDYHARIGSSKIRPIHDTLNFAQLVFRIALYFAPLKMFLPVSFLLLLLALSWAIASKLILGKLADISTLIIVMAAMQVAMSGMLAELVNRRLPNYSQGE